MSSGRQRRRSCTLEMTKQPGSSSPTRMATYMIERAPARDELRRLSREGHGGQHAATVGRAARARVVQGYEADELAVVRRERDEQLVALVPGLFAVGGRGSREVCLEARGGELFEEVI